MDSTSAKKFSEPLQCAAPKQLLAAVVLFCALISCSVYKEKPSHLGKAEEIRDGQGRLTYRKFEKLVDNENRKALVTVIQNYDTAGRLVKERGFDDPQFGKQYLIECFYGDSIRVINYFKWNQADTGAFESDRTNGFYQEKIFIDTSVYLKQITITKISYDKGTFLGRYLESYPLSGNSWANDTHTTTFGYTFELDELSFLSGKLDLGKARRLLADH